VDRYAAPIPLARYPCSVRPSSAPMVIRRVIYRLVRIGLVNSVMGPGSAQAFGEYAIQLNRAALLGAARAVQQSEVELGSVEAAPSAG
jgi:hypothetical protein